MREIKEFTDIELAFPTSVDGILPKWDDVPNEFKRGNTEWNKLFNDWFFGGIKNLELSPKEGIDADKALRMIRYCMASWEPKHEHKEAGCAFLFSEFFESCSYEKAG